jgi:putative Mn2+ efflux pump MntP
VGFVELFLIAAGLSMDAFAVAVCAGLTMEDAGPRNALRVAAPFGVFQAAMPAIGYAAGAQFADVISDYDHWAAFLLLAFIGGKMIFDVLRGSGEDKSIKTPDVKTMLPLAFATSVDALAVGVSLSLLDVRIVPACLFIGCVTLVVSLLGVRAGKNFGAKSRDKAELAGGIVLIAIGLKILAEHLGLLPV